MALLSLLLNTARIKESRAALVQARRTQLPDQDRRAGLHAFRNESDKPASMLLLFAPGAPRERYFEGLTDVARLSDEERTKFFIDHDSYFITEQHVRSGWTRKD